MNKAKIFNSFIQKYPNLVKRLENCRHAYDDEHPNPWHNEDDCWSHTKLVYEALPNDASDELCYAALFHDMGKPDVKRVNHERKRCSFHGHEFASLQYFVDFYINEKLNLNFENIVLGIANHLRFHEMNDPWKIAQICNHNEEYYKLLYELEKADSKGSISNNQYPEKEYVWNPTKILKSLEDCQVVFFGGAPGCGKDYIAEHWGDASGEGFDKKFSWDDIRVELYQKENPKGWKNLSEADLYSKAWSWCNSKKIDLNGPLKKKIEEALQKDQRVGVCNTFCTIKNRSSVFNLVKRGTDIGAVHVFAEHKTMVARDKSRSARNLGEEIINKFAYQQVLPTMDEGFAAVNIILNR